MSINVSEEAKRAETSPSAQTEEEFQKVLAKSKLANPEKFAFKEANGEWDRQRALLGIVKSKEEEEKPKRGRPAKEEPKE